MNNTKVGGIREERKEKACEDTRGENGGKMEMSKGVGMRHCSHLATALATSSALIARMSCDLTVIPSAMAIRMSFLSSELNP